MGILKGEEVDKFGNFFLLAYRRKTLYKAYEDVNSKLSREKKLGVPQYFGIYYAIGEPSLHANWSHRHSSLSFILYTSTRD